MPATDKRNSSVDRKNRSHYPNEGGQVERYRPAQRSQKAFTVISQTKSDTRSNIRSRSRSKAVEEINDRRRRTDYPQQQEHRSLKDKSSKERDFKYNDDKKNKEKSTKKVNLSHNVREEKNTKSHSDSLSRRSTYEVNIHQRNKDDHDYRTKHGSNKYDSGNKVKQKNESQNEDRRKSRQDQIEQKNKKRSEKTDDHSRKLSKPETQQTKDSPQHHERKRSSKTKSNLESVTSLSKSAVEKLPAESKSLINPVDEDSKGEDYYEDDFEDYESDFESDDDDDNEDEDSTNNETDEDSGKSYLNKDDAEKHIQEFKSQKPLNRRLSVASLQEAKLSSLDNYEKQVLMKALKQENEYVEEYQHRLRSGHEKPVTMKQLDNASSIVNDAGSRRKSFQSSAPSFINFSHAKSRQTTLKELGKTLIRKKELIDSNRITLNEMVFDLFDLPPIDYETYIQSFGKSNARQALSQTNEDDLHEEVQTDEIIVTEKWTQQPAHDFLGVGGDGIITEDNEDLEKILRSNAIRFSKFVKQAGEVVINLLEEDEIMNSKKISNSESNHNNFSQEYFQLGNLPFNGGGPVIFLKFSVTESHLLMTIHGMSDEDENILDSHGLICIWNIHQPSLPQKYLICSSQPLCGCFNPGKANLVFAGLLDGSVIAWDLREPSSMHKSIKWGENDFIFRFPAYITAGILHEDTHYSSVLSLDSAEIGGGSSSGSSLSEQQLTYYVASIEEYGILKLWTVMEVLQPNPSGTDTDFGLAPGSRIRLIRNSTINLFDLPGLNSVAKADLRALEVRFLPNDSNTLLIATDMGIIIHCNNQGNNMIPPFFSSGYELSEASCIDCAPNFSLFLVGCSDGTIRLHVSKKEKPVLMWPSATDSSIVQIQWAGSSQFYTLDSKSRIYKWDLIKNKSSPTAVKDFPNQRILHFHMNNESSTKHYSTSQTIHMAVCFDTGKVEIHKIYLKPLSNEEEFMTEILHSF